MRKGKCVLTKRQKNQTRQQWAKKTQQEDIANTGKETDTPVSARNEKSAPALWLAAAPCLLVNVFVSLQHEI